MPSFLPVIAHDAKTLIVGTWPSPKSWEQNFYYGHPQNRFWPMLAEIYGLPLPQTQAEKETMILSHKLALWDTVASCTIEGAADATIRDVVPNKIAELCATHGITKVLCNGATAYRLYCRWQKDAPPAVILPSTSPANARFRMAALRGAWEPHLPK